MPWNYYYSRCCCRSDRIADSFARGEGVKRHASFVSKIHVVWSRNSSFWRSLSRDPDRTSVRFTPKSTRNIIHIAANNSTLQWCYTWCYMPGRSRRCQLRDNDTPFSNIVSPAAEDLKICWSRRRVGSRISFPSSHTSRRITRSLC